MQNRARELDEASTAPNSPSVVEFGCYCLDVRRRCLLKGHRRVPLSGRPMSILIVLAQRADRVVTKRELEDLLWPRGYVREGTLRVHIAALQKALGRTEEGSRFVENITGYGYRLTVPVRYHTDEPARALPIAAGSERRLIGRVECVRQIVTRLYECRLLTLTGPGGIGKTAVALKVAEELSADYSDGVWIVDLTAVEESHRVADIVAATLGIAPSSPDPLAAVLEFLKQRSGLLILDNCEHVLQGAMQLGQAVLRAADRVRLLATSRERLHAEGEGVYPLTPLEIPAQPGPWTRDQLLSVSAVLLFMVRASTVTDIPFSDSDLQVIANLCRRLDGNPLAIEIAAAQASLLGLPGLIKALDEGHYLCIAGHKTRVVRQWTLRTTLDWSYRLLSSAERTLFCRLGIFCGSFDLEAAIGIAPDGPAEAGAVFEGLLSLTSKSLLVQEHADGKLLYRLHETSRGFALDKLRERGELASTCHRHALWWCYGGAQAIHTQLQEGIKWAVLLRRHVEDLRAAIQWCYSDGAGITPDVILRMLSLWLEFVLAAESGGAMGAAGMSPDAQAAQNSLLDGMPQPLRNILQTLPRDTDLASGAGPERMGVWMMRLEHLFERDSHSAHEISATFAATPPDTLGSPAALIDSVLALAHFRAGALAQVRVHIERALSVFAGDELSPGRKLQFAHLQLMLARTLWLQGMPHSALSSVRAAMAAAQDSGNLHMLGICQLCAASLAIQSGYQHDSRIFTGMVRAHARHPGMEVFKLWTVCLEVLLAARTNTPRELFCRPSIEPRESSACIDAFGALSEELMSHDAILRAEHGSGGWLTAEALRVKAERIVQAGGQEAIPQAQTVLQQALLIARAQGALFWEHRVISSQARLLQRQARSREARDLLVEVRARFSEGFDTADLIQSQQLLDQLDAGEPDSTHGAGSL